VIAVLLLVGTGFLPEGAQAPTNCYVDQAGVTSPVRLSKIGWTYGIGSAHGVCMVGADGVCYEIISECTPSGTEDKPQRPGNNGGAQVQAWWDYYWTGPDADCHRRATALPPGRNYTGIMPPTGACSPGGGTLGCVPHHPPASGTFAPIIFPCGGTTPTPIPTSTPVPTADPYAAWDEELAREGITAGCGGNKFCPDAPLTREQAAVWLLKALHGAAYVPPPCTGVFVDVKCQ
jgi:hypothetical protein